MVLVRIYKIENNINELIYISSTIKSLDDRLNDYKNDMCNYSAKFLHTMQKLGCHNHLTKLLYTMQQLGYDNFYISLIEEIECNDLDEARIAEECEINKYDVQILLNK
jgi:hypothetical protein